MPHHTWKEGSRKEKIEEHVRYLAAFLRTRESIDDVVVTNITSKKMDYVDILYEIKVKDTWRKGYVEAKQDYWETPNFVSEGFGYIPEYAFKHFDFIANGFKGKDRTMTLLPHDPRYDIIHDFVSTQMKTGNIMRGIKLGLGFANKKYLSKSHLFAYNRRKKNTCYYWKALQIRDYTIQAFASKRYRIIIPKNTYNGRTWYGINLLITYKEVEGEEYLKGTYKYD